MSYLHRFKLSEIDTCPCDDATTQDVPHLLMQCPIFSYERMQLEARCRSVKEDLLDIKSVISHKDLSREVVSYMVRIVQVICEINKCRTPNAEHSSSGTEGLLTSVNSPASPEEFSVVSSSQEQMRRSSLTRPQPNIPPDPNTII